MPSFLKFLLTDFYQDTSYQIDGHDLRIILNNHIPPYQLRASKPTGLKSRFLTSWGGVC